MFKLKILAVVSALGVAMAADAQVLTDTFVGAATPSQEIHTPTLTVGFNPTCLASVRLANVNQLRFRIRCQNITGITAAHIHGPASADANASPIATLFSGPATGDVNGELVVGDILRGTIGSAAFDDLLAKLRSDQTYFNVHTSANTAGEVRGQLSGIVSTKTPLLLF